MSQIGKYIVSSDGETNQAQEGKTFNEVYNQLKGKDVNLYLRRFNICPFTGGESMNGQKQALIGNCKDYLIQADYWTAYDQVI